MKEKPQRARHKQVKLRTVSLYVLTKVLCELSITEAATIHGGEARNGVFDMCWTVYLFLRRIHLIDLGSKQNKKCLKCLSSRTALLQCMSLTGVLRKKLGNLIFSQLGSIRARDGHLGKKNTSSH